MQNFQTAATVLAHRNLHSAISHLLILPQRGIEMTAAFILKHKDDNVALLRLDTKTCELYSAKVLRPLLMPVLGDPEGLHLCEWLDSRTIPDGRRGLQQILREMDCETSQELLLKNFALSLDDCYWICPASIPELTWESVNLFSHTGQVLHFHDGEGRAYYTSSVNVNGSLPKKADYHDGRWYLTKYDEGSSGEGLRNINEAFASLLHRRQNFPEYVAYSGVMHEGVCEECRCAYFTDERHEFLSANDVTGGFHPSGYQGKAELERFVEICVGHGLSRDYVMRFLDYQILTDFLISNTDRHWGNFGILRDPDTLEFLSMAPIFDSGTSMVWNEPYIHTRLALLRMETHGVEKLQEKQLLLVRDTSVVDPAALPDQQEVMTFYEHYGVQELHARQIASCYAMKKDMLLELQQGQTVSIAEELGRG